MSIEKSDKDIDSVYAMPKNWGVTHSGYYYDCLREISWYYTVYSELSRLQRLKRYIRRLLRRRNET